MSENTDWGSFLGRFSWPKTVFESPPRVAGTNIPVHVVDEPAAVPAVLEAAASAPVVETYVAAAEEPVVAEAVAQPAALQPIVTPQVAYAYLPYATRYQYLLEPGELIQETHHS